MKQLRIDWNSDYGMDHRKGWSIAVNGSYIIQFERFLIVAIVKCVCKLISYGREFWA